MAVKTITITEDAYGRLKSAKLPEESFSEAIKRITTNRPLSDFFGILTKEEAYVLEKNVEENRRANRALSVKRAKELRRGFNNGYS